MRCGLRRLAVNATSVVSVSVISVYPVDIVLLLLTASLEISPAPEDQTKAPRDRKRSGEKHSESIPELRKLKTFAAWLPFGSVHGFENYQETCLVHLGSLLRGQQGHQPEETRRSSKKH